MGTEGAPENVKHGDTIDIEITGIGTLINPVMREDGLHPPTDADRSPRREPLAAAAVGLAV
jgi:hypothetical protein